MDDKRIEQLFKCTANCIEILDNLTKELEIRCQLLEERCKMLEDIIKVHDAIIVDDDRR